MTLPRQLCRTKNESRLRPIKSPLASVSMRIQTRAPAFNRRSKSVGGLAPFETGIVDAAGDAPLAAPVNCPRRVNRRRTASPR